MWAIAVRTLGDREEAADAVQDALISAYKAADRFRGDSAVTTWLHRIVVNACLDRARRRQARPTVPLGDGQFGALMPRADAPYDSDMALTVRAALGQLPPEQRVALVLLDVEGYPVAEIAAMLGVAEGTVKSRCARGRARLAILLGHLRPGRPGQDSAGDAGHGNLRTTHDVGSTGPPPESAGADRAGQGGQA